MKPFTIHGSQERTETSPYNFSTLENWDIGKNLLPAAGAVLLVLATACTTTVSPPVTARLDFPSPLEGPGRTQLTKHQTDRITEGWIALSQGDTTTAASQAQFAGSSPQAQLLEMQARLYIESSQGLVQDLSVLTENHGGYASAWITLSVAAERVGDEPTALVSARKGQKLWPSGPFSGRVQTLETLWITDRLKRADTDIQAGDFETASAEIALVLELEPESEAALLASARALIGLGNTEQAESALSRLGDRPEAIEMRARIAYKNRQWNRSMDLLSRLPEDYPGRQEALRRARLRWRLSILPQYVQDAVESAKLTREQLAVLLVALTPELETMHGGQTPLMSDVLKLPSQRSILTVTRLGIMIPDPIDNRFYPDRVVTVNQARDAFEAISHLMGTPLPTWCDSKHLDLNGCTLLEEPLTGSSVTDALLTFAVEDPEA